MSDEIKLNRNQLARLHEIGRGKYRHAGIAKASTARLEALGLVEVKWRHIATTGRVMAHGDAYLTEAGKAFRDEHPI